jgi:hypothetical protein
MCSGSNVSGNNVAPGSVITGASLGISISTAYAALFH